MLKETMCAILRASGPTASAALAASLGAVLASAPFAAAQDAAPRAGSGFVVLGAGFAPDYVGSDDYAPIPFIAGRYDAGFAVFSLRGLGVAVDLASPHTGGAVSAGPIVRFQMGRGDVDGDAVDRLPDVDASVEVGGFASYAFSGLINPFDRFTIGVDAVFDAGGGHGGYVVTPRISYGAPLSRRLRATLGVSADFGDDAYAESFFGIDAAGAAASGLTAFDADAGFHRVGVALGGSYAVTESWGLSGTAAYSRMIGDAADSPVVDDAGSADQFFGGLGALYRF